MTQFDFQKGSKEEVAVTERADVKTEALPEVCRTTKEGRLYIRGETDEFSLSVSREPTVSCSKGVEVILLGVTIREIQERCNSS